MENEEKEVGADATTKENTGTTEVTENKSNYEELSKTDKELQSYVDRRVSDALKTAKTKWQEDLEAEKTEAEKLAKMKSDEKLQYQLQKEKSEKDNALAELNAYKLKEQALNIASEKGLDVSLLSYFDFKTLKAEEINSKIDEISTAFNKAVEKVVNERLKEDTPITKTATTTINKTVARASY
ncbi:MAG: DUF4355 domain-containing protein [Clostridia bacterium]|nr:DUF4355 domain-containing protein [Clostridia bacterium]